MDREHVLAAYTSAWSRTTGEAIRLALQDCWTEASTYVNPLTDVVRGIEGLINLILDFPVMFPGASMGVVRQPDIHHDAACLRWRMRSTAPIRTLGHDFGHELDGVDFIEFDGEGRIRRITAFFGLAAPAGTSARQSSARQGQASTGSRPADGAPRAESAQRVLGLPDDEADELAELAELAELSHPALG